MRGDWFGYYSSINNPKGCHGFMENTGRVCAGQGCAAFPIQNISYNYLAVKIQIWGQSDKGIGIHDVKGEDKNSFKGILGRIHHKYSWSEFGGACSPLGGLSHGTGTCRTHGCGNWGPCEMSLVWLLLSWSQCPGRCQSPWQELSPSSSSFSFPPLCSQSRVSSSGREGSINQAGLSPATAAAQPGAGCGRSGMNPSLPSKGQTLSSRLSDDLVPTKAESPLKQLLGSQLLYK